MMEQDAVELCGPRYGRKDGKAAVIAGARPTGKIGFHGGKVAIERPRVRSPRRPRDGRFRAGKRRRPRTCWVAGR